MEPHSYLSISAKCGTGENEEDKLPHQPPSVETIPPINTNQFRAARFNIESPKDKGMRRREDLLLYQKYHRGVRVTNSQSLPVISYRLRNRDKMSDSLERRSVMSGWSDDSRASSLGRASMLPKIYSSFDDRCSDRYNPGFRLAPAVNSVIASRTRNDSSLQSNDDSFVVSQKIHLSEREQKMFEKPSTQPHVVIFPCANNKHPSIRVKRVTPSLDSKEKVQNGSNADSSLQFSSNRIGPTTKHNNIADSSRTLADVLRSTVGDIQGSDPTFLGFTEGGFNYTNTVHSKLNTRLIDDHSYDIFARTERTPD